MDEEKTKKSYFKYKLTYILTVGIFIFIGATIINKVDNIKPDVIHNNIFIGTESNKIKIKRLSDTAGVKIPSNMNIRHLELMEVTARYYNIPLRRFLRQAYLESEFKSNAKSPVGAKGYFQIMDATYRNYRRSLRIIRLTPENNIRISGLILTDLKQQYGSWEKAYSAYLYGIPKSTTLSTKYIQFIMKE